MSDSNIRMPSIVRAFVHDRGAECKILNFIPKLEFDRAVIRGESVSLKQLNENREGSQFLESDYSRLVTLEIGGEVGNLNFSIMDIRTLDVHTENEISRRLVITFQSEVDGFRIFADPTDVSGGRLGAVAVERVPDRRYHADTVLAPVGPVDEYDIKKMPDKVRAGYELAVSLLATIKPEIDQAIERIKAADNELYQTHPTYGDARNAARAQTPEPEASHADRLRS